MRVSFVRSGLGYALTVPQASTEIGVGRVVRSRGELSGEVRVTCGLPGLPRGGRLHHARLNLSSTSSRNTLARHLATMTPREEVPWADLLEEFCTRVLEAERTPKPAVTIGSLPERLRPRFLLDPILANGVTTILYGEGGVGKSTLAVAMAVSVQTGIEIVPGFRPTPWNVLYLDWETDEWDVDEKVKAIAAGAELEDPVSLLYRPMTGPLSDQLESLAVEIASERIGLVVVDSVGMASLTGIEGDAAESALSLFHAFRDLGATVLAVDHIAKSEVDTPGRPSRPYGSIYKVNLARSTFELRRAEGTDAKASLGLYNTKANLAKRLPPIGLWIEHGERRIRFGRQELTGSLVAPLTIADRIEDALRDGSMKVADIAVVIDVETAKVRTTLHKAKGRRFVQLDDGTWGLLRVG